MLAFQFFSHVLSVSFSAKLQRYCKWRVCPHHPNLLQYGHKWNPMLTNVKLRSETFRSFRCTFDQYQSAILSTFPPPRVKSLKQFLLEYIFTRKHEVYPESIRYFVVVLLGFSVFFKKTIINKLHHQNSVVQHVTVCMNYCSHCPHLVNMFQKLSKCLGEQANDGPNISSCCVTF